MYSCDCATARICLRSLGFSPESVQYTYRDCIIPTGARASMIISCTSASEAIGHSNTLTAVMAWARYACINIYNTYKHVYYIHSGVEPVHRYNVYYTWAYLRIPYTYNKYKPCNNGNNYTRITKGSSSRH